MALILKTTNKVFPSHQIHMGKHYQAFWKHDENKIPHTPAEINLGKKHMLQCTSMLCTNRNQWLWALICVLFVKNPRRSWGVRWATEDAGKGKYTHKAMKMVWPWCGAEKMRGLASIKSYTLTKTNTHTSTECSRMRWHTLQAFDPVHYMRCQLGNPHYWYAVWIYRLLPAKCNSARTHVSCECKVFFPSAL